MEYDHVVLAAGRSSRMGFPKGLLRTPTGENFILTRSRRNRTCGARRTFLVLGFHSEKTMEQIKPLPGYIKVVINENPELGQTGSFKTVLQKKDYSSPVMMEPVDLPPLPEKTYREYLGRCRREEINIPVYEDRWGHPPLFPGWFLEEVEEMPIDRGINSLYKKHGDRIVEIPVDDERILLDLDRPEDYENYLNNFPGAGR